MRKKYNKGGKVPATYLNLLQNLLTPPPKPEIEELEEEDVEEEEIEEPKELEEEIEESPIESKTKQRENNFRQERKNYIDSIIKNESRGNYKAESPTSSAKGKYQFVWGKDGKQHGNEIMRLTGVKNAEEFLESIEAQEQYFAHWDKNTLTPTAKKYHRQLQKIIPGITLDEVKMMTHFAGPGTVQDIATGKININDFKDANKTTIMEYLGRSKKSYGGIAQGIASAAPAILNLIDGLNTGYSRQPVVTARQSAQFNPYGNDFGNSELPMFALGGQVPIEAEGQEFIETPQGEMGMLQGPSHEQGGIDMEVPEGTKIYSDRIAIDGKTMAQRKEKREKAIKRLEKLLLKNPNDKLIRNSLERLLETSAIEEMQDLKVQEAAQTPPSPQAPTQNRKYDVGTPGTGVRDLDIYGNPINIWGAGEEIILPDEAYKNRTNIWGTNEELSPNIPLALPKDETSPVYNPTIGDYVGMAGSLFNAVSPIAMTLKNRSEDIPAINHYQGFGVDALKAIEESKNYIANQRENALTALRQQMNSAKASTRNNTSSINAVRALDMATDLNYNTGASKIYDNFAEQMMQVLGQQAQLENQQDQFVMRGDETMADIAARDRDNFNTQLSDNLTNFGKHAQNFGKNLNSIQTNKDVAELMQYLTENNLSFRRDKNGKLELYTP